MQQRKERKNQSSEPVRLAAINAAKKYGLHDRWVPYDLPNIKTSSLTTYVSRINKGTMWGDRFEARSYTPKDANGGRLPKVVEVRYIGDLI